MSVNDQAARIDVMLFQLYQGPKNPWAAETARTPLLSQPLKSVSCSLLSLTSAATVNNLAEISESR